MKTLIRFIKKIYYCRFKGIHNWSKDINERIGQFHTAVVECKRCDERKIVPVKERYYGDIFN
jgi:hypothetical protein